MNGPLVSVVVSSYNRPSMLLASLHSVLGQTYTHLEILIQDDSTNDECQKAVATLNDPRLHYTRNQPPLGTIRNLRAGYLKCTGVYFSTLNDDDLYGSTYLETMVRALESDPRYVMAFADHNIIDNDGNIEQQTTNQNSITFGRDQLKEGSVPDPLVAGILNKSVPGMFAVFRRDAMDLHDFPVEVSSGYDYWLTYLAVKTGRPIYYSPERLTHYRVHAGSQTSSFTDPRERLRSLKYSEYMHHRFLADPALQSIRPTLSQRLAEIEASTGFTMLRMLRRREGSRHFLVSCKTKLTAKGLAGLALCFMPRLVVRRVMSTSRSSGAQAR